MKKIYFLLLTLLISVSSIGQTTVFVNEIHYDNGNGGDVNEGFEIAGPAGTDLTGWTVAKYNGSSTQLSVYGTEALSGTITDQQGGYGTIWFGLPSNGLQNGSPDGLALVAADGTTVIQFLSYEGSFTAADGPAMGMTSVDIGVAESGATLGTESLQLEGTGTTYENFTWASPEASTNGAVNGNQTFGAPVPTISITSPSDFAVIPSGTASVDIVYSTTNTMAGDTVDITVTVDGGSPTTTTNVMTNPFVISPTADGEQYEVTAELIRGGGTIDFETIDFSIAYPCDLQLGAVTTTCDATTSGVDTYTTMIEYTGGATSTYMLDTGGIGTISGNDPTVTAAGTITITNVNEEVDFTLTITGDAANSSCNIMQDVNGPTCVSSVCSNPGDIIISEIMRNPDAVGDGNGEYFEVYNASGATIDMQGWTIKDDVSATESHVISSSVPVLAGGYAVFVIDGNMATNGGIMASYGYSGVSLGNSGTDGIILECSGTVIDQVIWDGTFPSATAGVAMELTSSLLARNNTDNDDGANWGPATSPYGDGDLGTPGAANDFLLSNDDFNANSFSVYPNPTSTGFVNIKSNSGSQMNVQVFDILGKSVLNQSINNGSLEVSSLKTGVYIMRITQDSNTATKKLVIK